MTVRLNFCWRCGALALMFGTCTWWLKLLDARFWGCKSWDRPGSCLVLALMWLLADGRLELLLVELFGQIPPSRFRYVPVKLLTPGCLLAVDVSS